MFALFAATNEKEAPSLPFWNGKYNWVAICSKWPFVKKNSPSYLHIECLAFKQDFFFFFLNA